MDEQKGELITKAFRYIQQVCKECQRVLFKIDNLMAPEWNNVYGNRITKSVSSSLREPEKWIIESIFRTYESEKSKNSNKCFSVSFWGDGIDQPILTAGKIIYSDISKRDHWDLWNIWFANEDDNDKNKYELDGEINHFQPKESLYIQQASVFSLPLLSISDDTALIEKVVNPLKAL